MRENQYGEQSILQRITGNDVSGLRALMELYFPILSSFAEKFVTDSLLAQDIAQETFIKIWEHRGSFEHFGALRKFMYVTARNASLNAVRARQRAEKRGERFEMLKQEEERFVMDEIIYAELMADIHKAVATLPVKMKKVFLLAYVERCTNQEIADRLQLSQQTVRNQKSRALKLIQQRLGNEKYLLLVTLYTASICGHL